MKKVHCAIAVSYRDKISTRVYPIPLNVFYNGDFGRVFMYIPEMPGENPSITHMAFGKTKDDATRRLEALNFREYGKRIFGGESAVYRSTPDPMLTNESFWRNIVRH